MKRLIKAGDFIKTLVFIFPMTFRSCPVLFLSGNMFGLFAGLLIGVQTSVTAAFFNAVSVMAADGYKKVVLWGIALGAVVLGNEVVNGLMNFFLECASKKATVEYQMRLQEKAGNLTALDYEKPENLNLLEKASQGAQNASRFMSEVMQLFTIYIPYLLYMGFYLYRTSPVLAFSLPVIFLPVVLNQAIRSRIFAETWNQSASERRKRDYFRRCIADREYMKETRILGETEFFAGKFQKALSALVTLEHEADKRTDGWRAVMAGITLLGYCGVLFLLVRSLIRGEIRVGSFAAVFASVDMMYGIMNEIVEGRLGSIARNYGMVKNFMDFLAFPDLRTKEAKGSAIAKEGIAMEVTGVHFRYPGMEKESLRNVSFTIKEGETLAIVGENGAGKSTLMKVMMGMYLPESGAVRIYGSNTAKESRYEMVSAVFQQFQRYQMTLRENVAISVPGRRGGEYIDKALEQAGIPQDAFIFPEEGDTMLSRQFGGKELSGGQWQRIAIARGIYRTHDILFLDEPTAAIDPVEETELYHRFEKMCEGKTAVIVTHRMGCAKIADRIIVMKDGEKVEEGTHQELFEKGGWYRYYWDMQAKKYLTT